MTEENIPQSEWDREARLAGRLAMIETAIGALIVQTPDVDRMRSSITRQLDLMTGRNPTAQMNKTTAETARGAAETARHLLATCDLVKNERAKAAQNKNGGD